MKVIFLDIDGVVNSEETLKRSMNGIMGIDPYLAFIVGKISLALPDVKFVLSSSWRHFEKGRSQVAAQVVPIFDETPKLGDGTCRGDEIKAWLDDHHEVNKYAIIDDNTDMLEEQLPNFFKTDWKVGITEEIAQKIIAHLS